MSVSPEKLESIATMCHEWQNKKIFSKRQLQSLLGSLLFISKCVRPARVFLNCMLEFLRLMGTQKIVTVNCNFSEILTGSAHFAVQWGCLL